MIPLMLFLRFLQLLARQDGGVTKKRLIMATVPTNLGQAELARHGGETPLLLRWGSSAIACHRANDHAAGVRKWRAGYTP